ncbi:hypothetical protein [Bordetella petrii]|uniref:hypothetical protein n=1 Tax=Bordetella petrii TaxID=94624 RepID=UPI001E366BCB|nr:hypothetical protein [Bordetella petrii]MCD0502284.1 hypothetical protein [Bordetella petrii]
MTKPYTYDAFVPGTILGHWEEPLDDRLVATWGRLFGKHPQDHDAQWTGLAVALMMRAYLNVVSPRPPGNIHAQQALSIRNLPRMGEIVQSRVQCLDKEIRRERRYLHLEVSGTGAQGRSLYTGRMQLIWAA